VTTSERYVVLVTDPLAEEGLAVLSAEPAFDLRLRPGASGEDLRREVAEAHALLVRSGTKVTVEVLAAAPRLRVVGRAGTGVDNIDVPAATRRGVAVMNTPGGNSIAATEHTLALILSLFRNVPAAHRDLAEGNWNRKRFLGRQLQGKTLGLVGFGRIGREVALRARAFGMAVLAADPFVTEAVAAERDARKVDLPELLARADVVSLHSPLTPETRHLIGAAELAAMKPTAVLVNCARGGLVDEAALYDALEAGELAGAALDVYEAEPPEGNPLIGHPRVVATPHLGASTEEAQERVAVLIAGQVRDFFLEGEVRNAVNLPALSAELVARVRPYLDLAERLGSLAAQIAGAPFERAAVTFRGECTELPRTPVVSAALVGLLGRVRGGSGVNYVNARLAAGEVGLAVEERASDEAGDHAGLIEVSVTGAVRSAVVAGVVTAAGNPRLARWEGLGLDAPATGDILILCNPDVPGVVGAIGALLGDAGVNIAHIAWGRDPAVGEAYTLLNLDSPVTDAVLESLRRHPKVNWAERVQLP
jgi:D-3-phosphoglycerate dehydrogenase